MSKKAITIFVFLLFAAFVGVICILQYHQYHSSFQDVSIREHEYVLSMPDHAEIYDLNEISLSKLAAIPGVNKAHASAILAKREELGRFTDITQLAEIEVLPPSLLDTLYSFLYVLPEETTAPTTAPVSFPLDLNTADAHALMQIPGIGEKTAAAILAYRKEHNGFTSRMQLLEISGIGEATLSTIMDYAYIPEEIPWEEPTSETSPSTEPATEPSVIVTESEPPVIPVMDLNTVTLETLMLLPGCTESIAQQILELRDNIHYYSNPLEILYVEDITPELYGAWKQYLIAVKPEEFETSPASE